MSLQPPAGAAPSLKSPRSKSSLHSVNLEASATSKIDNNGAHIVPPSDLYDLHDSSLSGKGEPPIPNVTKLHSLHQDEKSTKKQETTTGLDKESDLEAGRRDSSAKEHAEEEATPHADSNIVDWNGPDDPQNPINWAASRKWGIIAILASISFLT